MKTIEKTTTGSGRMAEVGNAGQVAEEVGMSFGRIKAKYDAVPTAINAKACFSIAIDESTGAKVVDTRCHPARDTAQHKPS